MRSFITGSRIYGTPKANSDTDLVVLVSSADLHTLKMQADKVIEDDSPGGSAGGPSSASMMFGKLNLLATTSEDAFAVWRMGTVRCSKLCVKRRRILKRKESCDIFSKLRRIYLGEQE